MTNIIVNDVEKMFRDAIDEKTCSCRVCGKGFKSMDKLKEHVDDMACLTALDKFRGTHTEIKAYNLFKMIITEKNPTARMSIQIFRKSNTYGNAIKFSLFCSLHDLGELTIEYITWLLEFKGFVHINGVLSRGRSEFLIREFRKFCRINHEVMINSKRFFDQYGDDLIEDPDFLIRSLGKAKISIEYFASQVDDKYFDNLSLGHFITIEEYVDELTKN
jgi:hypothetical protein